VENHRFYYEFVFEIIVVGVKSLLWALPLRASTTYETYKQDIRLIHSSKSGRRKGQWMDTVCPS